MALVGQRPSKITNLHVGIRRVAEKDSGFGVIREVTQKDFGFGHKPAGCDTMSD